MKTVISFIFIYICVCVCKCVCIQNEIPRAATEKAMQRDTCKNTTDKSKWISKKCLSNPKNAGKRKQRN